MAVHVKGAYVRFTKLDKIQWFYKSKIAGIEYSLLHGEHAIEINISF